MGGKRRELLERAEELIKTYNPKRTTLESHATEFLSGTKTEADAAFLKEVLYGVMRCKAALKVFMACFFNDMSARVLRSDPKRIAHLAPKHRRCCGCLTAG